MRGLLIGSLAQEPYSLRHYNIFLKADLDSTRCGEAVTVQGGAGVLYLDAVDLGCLKELACDDQKMV